MAPLRKIAPPPLWQCVPPLTHCPRRADLSAVRSSPAQRDKPNYRLNLVTMPVRVENHSLPTLSYSLRLHKRPAFYKHQWGRRDHGACAGLRPLRAHTHRTHLLGFVISGHVVSVGRAKVEALLALILSLGQLKH